MLCFYKSTILPIIEYAGFVFDQDMNYVNKKIQTIQNQGLNVAYNLHHLPYNDRDFV